MKASELMVGDFCESFVDKEIVRIEWLTRDYPEITYLNVDMPNGMILQHNYTQLVPIPLTSEILEKNGWVFNDVPFINGWEFMGLTIHDWSISCGINISMNVRYVHELQRVLRLCGLNELADNFKV